MVRSPKVVRLPIRAGTGFLRVAVQFNGVWGWFSPPIQEKEDLFLLVAANMAYKLFPNRRVCLVLASTPEAFEKADMRLLDFAPVCR